MVQVAVCSASSVLTDNIFGPIQGVDLESGASALSSEREEGSLVSTDLHVEFLVCPYECKQ